MKQNGMIEYSDMIPLALTLLSSNSSVLATEIAKYEYIFCDEFQDTNRKQLQLLLKLSSHGRVTIVGDKNQLIFGFQGAQTTNFNDFYEHFVSRGVPVNVCHLNINYRSSEAIVKACNGMLTASVPSLSSRSTSGKPSLFLPQEMRAAQSLSHTCARKETLPVQVHESSGDALEYSFVCHLIRQLVAGKIHPSFLRPAHCAEGGAGGDLVISRSPILLDDIAVLFRTNAIGRAFKEYLAVQHKDIAVSMSAEDNQCDNDGELFADTSSSSSFPSSSTPSSSSTSASPIERLLRTFLAWLSFLTDHEATDDTFLRLLRHRFMSHPESTATSKITKNAIDTAELAYHQSVARSRGMFKTLGDVLELSDYRSPLVQRTFPNARALKSWYQSLCALLSEIRCNEIALSRVVDKVFSASNLQADIDNALAAAAAAEGPRHSGFMSTSSYSSTSISTSTSSPSPSLGLKRSRDEYGVERSLPQSAENEIALRLVNFMSDLKFELNQFLKCRGGLSTKHRADSVHFQVKEFAKHLEEVLASGGGPNESNYRSASATVGPLHNKGKLFLGTIHKAKGKEWKAVIILRANEDVFRFGPFYSNAEAMGMDEEEVDLYTENMDAEKRLLFVAMSRAKELLVISFVGKSRNKPDSQISSLLKPVLQMAYIDRRMPFSSSSSSSQPLQQAITSSVVYTFNHDLSKVENEGVVASSSLSSASVAASLDGFTSRPLCDVTQSIKRLCADIADNRKLRSPLETLNVNTHTPTAFQFHSLLNRGASSCSSSFSERSNDKIVDGARTHEYQRSEIGMVLSSSSSESGRSSQRNTFQMKESAISTSFRASSLPVSICAKESKEQRPDGVSFATLPRREPVTHHSFQYQS